MYQVAKFGFARSGRVVVAPDADMLAWVTAVEGAGGSVSVGRQDLISALIRGLKTDGIWTKLDRLWIYAAENAISARIDLKALASHTVVGTPAYTVDRGYAGSDNSAPSGYIETNYSPSVNGVAYTQDSAHFSLWSRTNNTITIGGGAIGFAGSVNSYTNLYLTFSNSNVYGRINDAAESTAQGVPGTRIGHWTINRSGTSASQIYQNGALFSSPNATSGPLENKEIFVLAINGTGAQNGNSNELTMTSLGGSLNSTEAAAFYSRLATYMTAVGA